MALHRSRTALRALLTALALAVAATTGATTYRATTTAELQTLADGLVAGDTLLVAAGTYTLRTWRLRNLTGRTDAWIEIRPESGPVILQGDQNQNVINIDNVSHVRFSGFEITYVGASTDIDGLKLNAGTNSDHVILDHLHVHDVTGVGINSKAVELSFFDVSRCHVERTGGTGEGLYLGCQAGDCLMRDSTIRGNLVHDTGGSQGDGIEIKRASYRNLVLDNVVHDVDVNGYPGITLYRTDRGRFADNNRVARNVIWRAGEGIFTGAETTIENNIIFDCAYGINVRNYSGWGVSNLRIAHDTVFDCNTAAIRLGDWNVGTGVLECVGNAALQATAGGTAFQVPQGLGPGVASGNAHFGTSALPAGASVLTLPPASEVTAPSATPGVVDLHPLPGSTLLDLVTPGFATPTDDFDGRQRPLGPLADSGAYEGPGRGWIPASEFKPLPEDAGPFPVPDGATTPGVPVQVTKSGPGVVAVTWDVQACPSWNYAVALGALSTVSSYATSGAACYVSVTGRVDVDLPPALPSIYLLVVGISATGVEGSHGVDSSGRERPSRLAPWCSLTAQDLQACP